MSRLPVPGSDDGQWGAILNDFLAQALNADGTVKDAGVIAAKYVKPSGGIPESDLDSGVQTKLNSGGSVSDATTISKGIVQLAGDLTGTAAAPAVAAGAITAAKIANTTITDAQISGSAAIVQSKIANLVSDLAATEKTANKDQASGYAGLDSGTKVVATQLGGAGGTTSNFLRGDRTWATAVDSNASHYRGAWTASTAYVVNDIVTHHGEGLYLITTAHTSGTAFNLTNKVRLNGRARTYDVKDYGVAGDNATDDTAAINAVVAQAVSDGISDGTYFARVYFPPSTYLLSGATTKGGATQGNSQITLPVIPSTGRKFVLVFSGTESGSAIAHWEQTVGQRSGAVLRSTLTGQTPDGTWGFPSVVGGPTVVQGSGMFTNLQFVVEGVTVMAPHNPSLMGWDLKYVAQMVMLSGAALADAGVAGSPSLNTLPTNDQGIGLRVPNQQNNACNLIVDFACEGFYYGCTVTEHFTALRLMIVYCQVGLFVGGLGGISFHGASIVNYGVEATPIHIQCLDNDSGTFPIDIVSLHTETSTTWDVDDVNNMLTGTIHWMKNDNTTPLVRGGAKIKIISQNKAAVPGAKTPPSVSGSTVAFQNPFWRDCAVTISGGTVTGIAVDGTATGATTGTVIVPTGKTITLTYSVAPTWNWVAL